MLRILTEILLGRKLSLLMNRKSRGTNRYILKIISLNRYQNVIFHRLIHYIGEKCYLLSPYTRYL
jgi:hypothetical protein